MKMFPKITLGLGALALGAAVASVPAFAQEVWQTYPLTISTPAFGPGPVKPFVAAATPSARHLYNSVPQAVASPAVLPGCDVTQTYPLTISTPANGPSRNH